MAGDRASSPADGLVVHDAFGLPSTAFYGILPDAAMDGAGNYLIVWSNLDDVEGQLYLSRNIFADGFESGDLAAWSGALP